MSKNKQQPSELYIVWQDEWSVGHHELDEQHKTIISLINLYFNPDYSNTQKNITFSKVIEVMKNHLDYEENLLVENAYPDIEEHKRMHQMFCNKINQFSKNPFHDKHPNSDDIINLFKTWWLEHIINEDSKYVSFLPGSPPYFTNLNVRKMAVPSIH